jgi:hypothetical protein
MKNFKIVALVLTGLLLPSLVFAEIWYESETGNGTGYCSAKWIKQSGEKPGPVNFEGASYDCGNTTYNLTMYWVGNNVFIERRNSSDGNECNYNGTLIDKSNVRGEYFCGPLGRSKGSPNTWSAVIDSQSLKK